jgi:chromosome partitioning protein
VATIAIANHKGGVGKTATTLHLGGALSSLGFRTLLIDLDPMGGLTSLLRERGGPNLFTDAPAILPTSMDRVSLAPGGPALKRAEAWLAHRPCSALRDLLPSMAADHEIRLIDCPPQLDDFTKNALVAADAAILPVSCDTQDLLSLHKLLLTADELGRSYPVAPSRIALLTKFHGEAFDFDFQESLREIAPLLFDRPIRYSTGFRQAGLHGTSVFHYESEGSPARMDYLAVANDLLALLRHGGFRMEPEGEEEGLRCRASS